MGYIINEITIQTDINTVWSILADLELLEKCDPTVKQSTLVSSKITGVGAKRRVDMVDGKNWFEEKITIFKPHEALTYQLTDCSFPIKGLQHSYSFETIAEKTKVKQVMEYTVKYGFLGKLLDSLLLRKQFDNGIKQFLSGLKSYSEIN